MPQSPINARMTRDSDRHRRSRPEEQRGDTAKPERGSDDEEGDSGVRIIALGAVAGLLLFAVLGVAVVQSSPEQTPSYSDIEDESDASSAEDVEEAETETPGGGTTESDQETGEQDQPSVGATRYPSLRPVPAAQEDTTIRGISGTVTVANYDGQRFDRLAERLRAGQSLSLVDVGVTTATTENGTAVKLI